MSFDLAAFASDACTAQDAIRSVDRDLINPEVDKSHLPTLLRGRDVLNEIARDTKGCLDALDNLIAEVMDDHQVTVDGYGTVIRQPRIRRSNWQHEDLLRLVLDSRMVNPETGEVESHVDTLKAVYSLAGYNARITELRKRDVQVDEFCEEERRGWTLRIEKGGST